MGSTNTATKLINSMGTFEEDLRREQELIDLLALPPDTDDKRNLRLPYDYRVPVEFKTWYPNGLVPIETWSVLERNIRGWPYKMNDALDVYFLRKANGVVEKLHIKARWIKEFLRQDLMPSEPDYAICKKCRRGFELQKYNPTWCFQAVQQTDGCNYHSAALLVKYKRFGNHATYEGNQDAAQLAIPERPQAAR